MTNKAVITWKDKDVYIDGRHLISMPDNVVKALIIDHRVIILTIKDYVQRGDWTIFGNSMPRNELQCRNIIAVGPTSQMIWRVHIADDPIPSFYTNIWLQDGQLHGYLYSGWDVTLDHDSGAILQKVPMK